MLLKVIASQYIEWQMLMFTAKSNSDNWDISRIFRSAKEYAPSIICFEDLDTIFHSNITMSYFLNKLDGFGEQDRVMVIATTNHPEDVDPALLNRPSRFDRVWVIDNPDVGCRKIFIRKKFADILSDSAIEKLGEDTEKLSMAYMEELYVASLLSAINHGKDFPEEEDILEATAQLSVQIRGASNNFERKIQPIEFGV
jgi:ATP-dependent 26S proteasome regulatory subunit